MFNSKQTTLFIAENQTTSATTAINKTSTATTNSFVTKSMKKAAETHSLNGALKYATTDNAFVDQFSKLGAYKVPRGYSDINKDMCELWALNPYLTVCFIFFIRMITRVVSLFDNSRTTTVQRGAGLKHEGIMRMIWLHINHTDIFWNNIQLFISVGSWKDIIQILSYDLQYNGWKGRVLNWDNFGKLILAGLDNPNSVHLVKKYLPQIKSNSQCKTIEAQADNIIAKWICSLLFGDKNDSSWNYKQYRKLKSSGEAHQWQQLISQGKHNLVDFNTVHGRALALMVSGKYIENQGLTARYEEWISTKPIAKFTGYVHELFAKIPNKKYQIDTLNAQFMGLVETASKNANKNTSLIVVRDTSGSMGSTAAGTKQSCYDIAKAIALFFSYMLPTGTFANNWIEFNKEARMHEWKGNTPYEKWITDRSGVVGNTNFMSVINLFCSIKTSGVDESEFPTGIICISDLEFDPSQLSKTNVETALAKLSQYFSKEYVDNFKIVLWNLLSGNRSTKFENYGNTPNVYYFSGYDASTMAFLTGIEGQTVKEPTNAEELFNAAMSQEVMSLIKM